ncbi:TPA: hypothetical protein ACGUPI_003081, partial [Vibrio vulnificus]
ICVTQKLPRHASGYKHQKSLNLESSIDRVDQYHKTESFEPCGVSRSQSALLSQCINRCLIHGQQTIFTPYRG